MQVIWGHSPPSEREPRPRLARAALRARPEADTVCHNHSQVLVLYRAGVVTRRPEGANVYYSLADTSARAVLDEMLTSVKQQLRELSDLATQPPEES